MNTRDKINLGIGLFFVGLTLGARSGERRGREEGRQEGHALGYDRGYGDCLAGRPRRRRMSASCDDVWAHIASESRELANLRPPPPTPEELAAILPDEPVTQVEDFPEERVERCPPGVAAGSFFDWEVT